jgi:hypothetical protein
MVRNDAKQIMTADVEVAKQGHMRGDRTMEMRRVTEEGFQN